MNNVELLKWIDDRIKQLEFEAKDAEDVLEEIDCRARIDELEIIKQEMERY